MKGNSNFNAGKNTKRYKMAKEGKHCYQGYICLIKKTFMKQFHGP